MQPLCRSEYLKMMSQFYKDYFAVNLYSNSWTIRFGINILETIDDHRVKKSLTLRGKFVQQ